MIYYLLINFLCILFLSLLRFGSFCMMRRSFWFLSLDDNYNHAGDQTSGASNKHLIYILSVSEITNHKCNQYVQCVNNHNIACFFGEFQWVEKHAHTGKLAKPDGQQTWPKCCHVDMVLLKHIPNTSSKYT